jgi:hypothetical protein
VRKTVLDHPDYYRLREHLISFLENHAHKDRREIAPSRPPAARTPHPEAAQVLD